MIKIYVYKKTGPVPKERVSELLKILSQKEKIRHSNFKSKDGADSYLLGRYYLKQFISANLGVPIGKIEFKLNKYGRPALKNKNNGTFDFNLSHSGDWIVLALGDSRVGIDIEKIRKISPDLASNFFHQREIEYLNKKGKFNTDDFFKIWVLKESYIKAVGRGLSMPLKDFYFSVYFNKNKEYIKINQAKSLAKWNFKMYEIDKDYKLALCSEAKSLPNKIEMIK